MYKFKMEFLDFKKVIIFIVAIIILGFSYDFLRQKEQIISSLDMFQGKNMVSYVKDNKLYFINSGNKSILLSDKVFEDTKDSGVGTTLISYSYNYPYCIFAEKDTNIYFLGNINLGSNSGKLYRYDKNKGIEKIAEGIKAPIYVSPDGKKIAYSKLNDGSLTSSDGKKIAYSKLDDNNLTTSDLYIYEIGKTTMKILANCSQQDVYNFSWKTNSVAYTEFNNETNSNKLYIKKQFKDKELVDEGASIYTIFYSDDGNIMAYIKINTTLQTNDYYIKKSGAKSEHIATSKYFEFIPETFSAYYIGDDDKLKQKDNLYYKELNKPPVKIATEVRNIVFDGIGYDYNTYLDSLKQKRILFQKKDGMLFFVNEKKAPQKLGDLKVEEKLLLNGSANGFIIVNQADGKIKKGTYDKAKRSYAIKDIEDNTTVLQQENIFKNNKLFYIKKSTNDDYEFWSLDLVDNTKELIQNVSKNDSTLTFRSFVQNNFSSLVLPKVIDNTLYYSVGSELKRDLYIKKTGSKAIKIAETNGYFLPYDEDTVYYYVSSGEAKDIKYNLYVYQYGKGSKLLASEISSVNLSN